MMICDRELCTGCMACYNACHNKAIKIQADQEGFLRPHIVEENCTQCGVCRNVCPANKPLTINNNPQVYACWNNNPLTKQASTSGGAFTAFAEIILAMGGKVYGAAFNQDFNVVHTSVDCSDQLWKMRGSKYVQSEIGLTYKQIKEDLANGHMVLFSGTPCQVDALYSFLGKRYSGRLYTLDLLCHGAPSPKVWGDYMDHLQKKYKSKITDVKFRDKKNGWHRYHLKVTFESSEIYTNDLFHDPYSCGFLRNYFLRPSCHNCKYANTNRTSDITIGDFWGYGANPDNRDDDTGISLIILNTPNGHILFDEAKSDMTCLSQTLELAVNGNPALRIPAMPPQDREDFWSAYRTKPFSYVSKKYLYPMVDYTPKNPILRMKMFAYRMLGENVYAKIKHHTRKR